MHYLYHFLIPKHILLLLKSNIQHSQSIIFKSPSPPQIQWVQWREGEKEGKWKKKVKGQGEKGRKKEGKGEEKERKRKKYR